MDALDLLEILFFWPIGGLLDAVAGLLWPSDKRDLRRLQRILLAIVLVGVSASLVTGVAIHRTHWRIAGPSFAVAYLCFIIGGWLGQRIEARCKRETPPNA